MTSQELMSAIDSGEYSNLSGVSVTPANAMQVMAVYAAVRIIAETIAMIPIHIYRRLPNGGKERAPEHPLYRILNGNYPNEWQTSYEFKENIQGSMTLNGNGYSFINRAGNGDVLELLPILPTRVEPQQDKDFKVTYKVTMDNGQIRVFKREDILHFRGIGSDGLKGYNAIQLQKDSLGLTKAAEKYGAAFFGNAARPSGHFSTELPQTQVTVDRVKENIKEGFTQGNAAKVMVTDGGWKWSSISLTADEAQFMETRKFQTTEIARMFRVPPHMLADLEKSSFSNIEQQGQEFVTYTILPWVKRWEGVINKNLLRPDEQGEYFAEFLLDSLMRGDSAARSLFYKELFFMGAINADEIRDKENMNPLPDNLGKTYYTPVNMAPVNKQPSPVLPAASGN